MEMQRRLGHTASVEAGIRGDPGLARSLLLPPGPLRPAQWDPGPGRGRESWERPRGQDVRISLGKLNTVVHTPSYEPTSHGQTNIGAAKNTGRGHKIGSRSGLHLGREQTVGVRLLGGHVGVARGLGS